MRFRKHFAGAAAIAALALGITLPAIAAAEDGKGTVTYVTTWSESTPRPGGGTVRRNHSKGVIVADDPKNMIHGSSQTCQGAAVHGPDGAPITAHGICDSVDADGDTWSLYYAHDSSGRRWRIIGGTGKFRKMTGGGTTQVLVYTGDGRAVIGWEGTWER